MAQRVLTIGNLWPPAGGGDYERIWVAAVRALRGAGAEVRVLTSNAAAGTGEPGPPGANVDVDAVRELRWYSNAGRLVRPGPLAAWRIERHNAAVLRRELADFGPHAVLWFGMGGMSLSLIERVHRAGVPAVGVVGDSWMVDGPRADAWRSRIRRAVDLGAAAHWLLVSRTEQERIAAAGIDLPRSGLAHPGVEPARFPRAVAHPWTWRLAVVGPVEPSKGVDVAVRALAQLPDATLTVDGPADEAHAADLRALAADLGVAERLSFARTPPARVAEVYARADAILFPPTRSQPWGLVPLEAMSVGLPLVATAEGGPGEYLQDGVNALVVPAGDAAALADAVRRLSIDEVLRARLRDGGLATAARYTEARFCAAVVAALRGAA